jgi:hypothetical protein
MKRKIKGLVTRRSESRRTCDSIRIHVITTVVCKRVPEGMLRRQILGIFLEHGA